MIPQSITLPPNLRIIPEDFSLDDKESSITADYIASTGELSSANTDQVREGSSTCAHQQVSGGRGVEGGWRWRCMVMHGGGLVVT